MKFDGMYEFARSLPGSEVDEGEHELEIRVGDRSKSVQNRTCTIKARLGARGVVITWSAFHVEGFSASNSSYERNVLDVFVSDNSVVLEGVVRKRGLVGKLLAAIGLGGGWKPLNHSLFKSCKVERDDETDGVTRLEDPAYCDRVERVMGDACFKLEYQSKTGLSAYFHAGKDLSVETLDRAFIAAQILLDPVV